jgi:hypothetical protein
MDKSMLGKAFVIVYEHALASQDVDKLTADQRAILESMIDELVADRESVVSKLRQASKKAFLPLRTGVVA